MKIDPKERQRAVEQARPGIVTTWDNQHDALSKNERTMLRHALQRVQATATGDEELRARRLLTMLDGYEDAEHFRTLVGELITASEVEGLAGRIDAMSTSVNVELDSLVPANLDDVLAENPDTTSEEIVELCKAFYERRLAEVKKTLAQEFSELKTLTEGAWNALEKLTE